MTPGFCCEAKQIVKTPLQPMGFLRNAAGWETKSHVCQRRVAWALGPSRLSCDICWFRWSRSGARNGQRIRSRSFWPLSPFSMTVSLALRLGFTRFEASMSGLMLVAIPPFLSMASTAMPDTAACAFVVIGIERLLAWKSERRWTSAIASGVALGIAPTARFHAALMIPIAALWLFSAPNLKNSMKELRGDLRRWTPIAIGFGLLVLIVLVTRDRGSVTERPDALVGLTLRGDRS